MERHVLYKCVKTLISTTTCWFLKCLRWDKSKKNVHMSKLPDIDSADFHWSAATVALKKQACT